MMPETSANQCHCVMQFTARVSTAHQNLDSQLALLQQAGCQRIFQEHASGINRQRAGLQHMQEHLRPGDTVIVWKLDRLARSTRDRSETVEQIITPKRRSSRYQNRGQIPHRM